MRDPFVFVKITYLLFIGLEILAFIFPKMRGYYHSDKEIAILKNMSPRVFRFLAFMFFLTVLFVIFSIVPNSFKSNHSLFFFLFYMVFCNTIERVIIHLNKDTECLQKLERLDSIYQPMFSPKTRILLLLVLLFLMARLFYFK